MKSIKRVNASKQLINVIQLARLRVAKAESQLESAKEQARLAKRRRKEAKQAARLAKKHAREAKKEFLEAKEAMIAAEEKFAGVVERAVRNRKLARARLQSKAVAARGRKKVSRTSRVRRALKPVRGKSRISTKAPQTRPVPRKSRKREIAVKRVTKTPAPAAHAPLFVQPTKTAVLATPAAKKEVPILVPRDLETPQPVAPEIPPENQPPIRPPTV